MLKLFPDELFAQPRYWLSMLLLLGFGLLASGFVLQYGFHVLPCEMCWWQRYAHAAIGGGALVALLVPHPKVLQAAAGCIAASALLGLSVAVWQFAAQHGWLPFPAQCTSTGMALSDPAHLLESLKHIQIVPCDKENFRLFGLSLAGWNIPLMVLAAYIALRGGWKI